MSKGKYYSLEEARKQDKLKRFAKEHPSKGSMQLFDKLLDQAAKGSKASKKK